MDSLFWLLAQMIGYRSARATLKSKRRAFYDTVFIAVLIAMLMLIVFGILAFLLT